MITIINRVLRNRVRKISFPKLPNNKFNKLWGLTLIKFISLPIIELIPIIKCLILNFGATSLLAIPTIFSIIKFSDILEPKDTESHLKMFKALDVDNNNINYFFIVTLIFSLIIKIINILTWLFWLPIRLVIIYYILDYFNYDVIYLYSKINNLSLGTLDWYYRTLTDFLEALRFKYEFSLINHANNK